jgi:hypothetical protein
MVYAIAWEIRIAASKTAGRMLRRAGRGLIST